MSRRVCTDTLVYYEQTVRERVSRPWWQGSAADIVKHAMIQLHRRLAPREPRRPRRRVLAAAVVADDGVAAVQEEHVAVAMVVEADEKEVVVVVVAEGDAAAAAVEQEGQQPEEGEEDEEDTIEGGLWATLRNGGRCRMVRSSTVCPPALLRFKG